MLYMIADFLERERRSKMPHEPSVKESSKNEILKFLSKLPGLKDKIHVEEISLKNRKSLFQNLEMKCYDKGDYLFYTK